MAESVPVHCPACRRDHTYTAPTYPCACGAPLSLPVLRGALPVEVRYPSWESSWARLRCPACGRTDHWPQPEFGCACGALVRLPVDEEAAGRPDEPDVPHGGGPEPEPTSAPEPEPEPAPAPAPAPAPSGDVTPPTTDRPPFRPVTIRTGRDALTAAAQYLTWLGFADVRLAGDRTANGIDLRGRGLVAQVDPATRPTPVRDVECLWLNCANEDAAGAFFSLAGYAHDAQLRADALGVPLFVLDLAGAPQPVNEAAEALITAGPPPTP